MEDKIFTRERTPGYICCCRNLLAKAWGVKWLLEGDSNTAFFHKSANGRKRKSIIHSLEDEGVSFSEQAELREHITQYYKKLFGKEEIADIHLNCGIWSNQQKITPEENDRLTEPFTLEEVDAAVKEMRNGTAPGPDGFSIESFKKILAAYKR